jgi:hypothetical protein
MILIPSQFFIPFLILMVIAFLVTGAFWIREKRSSKPTSSRVKVISKGHEHVKLSKMDFDVFTFQHLSDGEEFEMSLLAGRSPEITVGRIGTLEYVAVKGKPKYFGQFIPETEAPD